MSNHNTETRIRIAGSTENCERILNNLNEMAKAWGKRKLIKIRKFPRPNGKNKYSRIFGNAEIVCYARLYLPPEEK